jgi:hypothetical protein
VVLFLPKGYFSCRCFPGTEDSLEGGKIQRCFILSAAMVSMLSLGLSKEKLTEHSELQKRSVSFLHDFVYLLILRCFSTSIIAVNFHTLKISDAKYTPLA